MTTFLKVVVFVPVDHADQVRQAAGAAGAGKIGDYTFCSFSSTGVGRFLPGPGANPTIGQVGRTEEVAEERIELTCRQDCLQEVVAAIKAAHPYEEVALDIYSLYTPG